LTEPRLIVCYVGDGRVAVRYQEEDCAAILSKLGGRKTNKQSQWTYDSLDDNHLASLLAALRDAGVPFEGGSGGWPPAEVFAHLRERGLLQGRFLEAVFRGPKLGWIVRER
jgi:hypothetical protein